MLAERVLVVIDEMEVGGSQRQVVNLLLGLAAQGRQAELLYFRSPSFLVSELAGAGVRVHRILKRGRYDPVFVWKLAHFLRQGRYDLVHCFSITAEVWVRLVLPLVPGTRFVCSVRGLSTELSPLTWRAKRWVLRRAEATISNSTVAAAYVAQRCGMPVDRFDVVPNGLELREERDLQTRNAHRALLGLPLSQPLLLFVGRLVPQKNLGTLLQAMALIPAGRRPLLWLAGEGPERTMIEALVRRLDLYRCVRLLGERDDVEVLMAAADMLVLPSREEGLSNVILEAMASGLPVVASAVGGNTELIEHGRTGLLCDPSSAQSIAESIMRLFDEPDLRRQLARCTREKVEREYSMEGMVERTMAIHDRCMGVA